MRRTTGLAPAAVRARPASFVGTFVALLMSALIVAACGTLLVTSLGASVAPERYASAPVVVAADQNEYVVTGSGEDREAEPVPLPDTARVDAALAARASRAPGVAAAVPDLTFPARAGEAPLTAHAWGSHRFTGTELTTGHAPGRGEVVLDAAAAEAAGTAVGGTVAVDTAAGARDFRVAGVAEPGPAEATGDARGLAWFADDEAPALAGHPGAVDAVAVLAEPGTDAAALAAAVSEALGQNADQNAAPSTAQDPDGSGALVLTGDDRGAVEEHGLATARQTLFGIGGSFGGIAAIVAVFTAAGTVALSVSQRAREFALLRAVGATPRQIRRAVAAEAALVAPLAGALGVLPGVGLAAWWFEQLQRRGAVPEGVELQVSAFPLLAAVGVGLLTALAAGWIAGRRPASITPGRALSEASVETLRPGRARTALGLAALVGGFSLTGVSANATGDDSAGAALGVVMLFMLAVGLLGPLVARVFASLFGLPLRGAGPSASLAAANSRTHARRLASATTPIVLAMAFASTLVFMHSSENHAAGEQLRAGVTAKHVVTDPGGLATDAVERAAATPGVDAAVGVLSTQVLVPTGSGEFSALQGAATQGVTGSGAELARVQDLGVRDGDLDRLGPGRVAVDRTLAAAAEVGVGDELPVHLPDGTTASPEVVAVYERGLGLGTVTMDRADLDGHVTAASDSMLLVSGGTAESLAPLGDITDVSGYATAQSTEAELGAWMNSTMAAVLGGFAAVAAVNTLVMTVLDRRRELGALRLVGATRRQVLAMLRWEGGLVAAIGVVLGSAIAAATLVPMMQGTTGAAPYVPPLVYAAFVAGAVGLALGAMTLPARGLLRRRA